MPLCPVTNDTIGHDMYCYSCDEIHAKPRTAGKHDRRDYIIAILGMNLIYLFILWLEANDY